MHELWIPVLIHLNMMNQFIITCIFPFITVGKSSLMKRISAGKIPGFPPHITSLLVSQEVFGHEELTPVDTVLENHRRIKELTRTANAYLISQLEDEMDGLDVESDDYQENMERICNRIAELEDDADDDNAAVVGRARDALHIFGVPESTFDTPTLKLSGGIRKRSHLPVPSWRNHSFYSWTNQRVTSTLEGYYN